MSAGKGRKRDLDRGLEGLRDELRPGRPRTDEDDNVAQVIHTALQSSPQTAARRGQLAPWGCQRPLQKHSAPLALDAHLIVDNTCTHQHAKVRSWLAHWSSKSC
jgi:hypothetical protein